MANWDAKITFRSKMLDFFPGVVYILLCSIVNKRVIVTHISVKFHLFLMSRKKYIAKFLIILCFCNILLLATFI